MYVGLLSAQEIQIVGKENGFNVSTIPRDIKKKRYPSYSGMTNIAGLVLTTALQPSRAGV